MVPEVPALESILKMTRMGERVNVEEKLIRSEKWRRPSAILVREKEKAEKGSGPIFGWKK